MDRSTMKSMVNFLRAKANAMNLAANAIETILNENPATRISVTPEQPEKLVKHKAFRKPRKTVYKLHWTQKPENHARVMAMLELAHNARRKNGKL